MNAGKVVTPKSAIDVARSLLEPTRTPVRIDTSAGYLDLLANVTEPKRSLAQLAMQNSLLARIYESAWRPMFTRGFSLGGPSTANHQRELMRKLAKPGDRRVLDVACGPGLYTREFARPLTGEGVAIGFDLSKPMLAQAIRDTGSERAAYIRGDAHGLPFADNTFDTVVCFAALYMMQQPKTVLRELARVVKPGGDVAIFTSLQTRLSSLPLVRPTIDAAAGIHVFGKDEITDAFRNSGLTDIDQAMIGQGQFVTARKAP